MVAWVKRHGRDIAYVILVLAVAAAFRLQGDAQTQQLVDSQAEQSKAASTVLYHNILRQCVRINRTLRGPLHAYYTKVGELRDIPPGVVAAAGVIAERTEPVHCRSIYRSPPVIPAGTD